MCATVHCAKCCSLHAPFNTHWFSSRWCIFEKSQLLKYIYIYIYTHTYIHTHFLSIVCRTQMITIFVGRHRIFHSICCSDASQLFLPLNIIFYLSSSIPRFQYLLCLGISISIHENTGFIYWLCSLMINIWFNSIEQAFGRCIYFFNCWK
jgi:hypothetical protein